MRRLPTRTLAPYTDTGVNAYVVTTSAALLAGVLTSASGGFTGTETPGLVAGRHISVDDTAGHGTSAGFAADSGSSTTIAVTAYTNLLDTVATAAWAPAGST